MSLKGHHLNSQPCPKCGKIHIPPMLGKHSSMEVRRRASERVRGDQNPQKRPEVRAKNSAAHKGKWCGDNNPSKKPEVRAKIAQAQRNPTPETRLKKSLSKLGEKNPSWEGGKSYEPYSTQFNKIIKEVIRLRDNYECQLCGISQDELGRKLDVHHIDGDKKNTHSYNLVSLCRHCHNQMKIHSSFWMWVWSVVLFGQRKFGDANSG